jgi:hypothetical protein
MSAMAESDATGDPPGDTARAAGTVVLEQRDGTPVLRVDGALDPAPAPKFRHLARAHRGRTGSVPLRVVATGRSTLRPPQLTRLIDELAVHPSLTEAPAA